MRDRKQETGDGKLETEDNRLEKENERRRVEEMDGGFSIFLNTFFKR